MKILEKLWKYDSYFNCVNCCSENFIDRRTMPSRCWDKYEMDRFDLGFKTGQVNSIGEQMEVGLLNELC